MNPGSPRLITGVLLLLVIVLNIGVIILRHTEKKEALETPEKSGARLTPLSVKILDEVAVGFFILSFILYVISWNNTLDARTMLWVESGTVTAGAVCSTIAMIIKVVHIVRASRDAGQEDKQ